MKFDTLTSVKYLGIDWGKRHIGLAVSDGSLADPYQELEVNSLNQAIFQIEKVIQDESVEEIVIGMPESGEAQTFAKKGVLALRKKGFSVSEADETLTSHHSQGEHKKAAALILQEYLDNLH